MIYNPLIDEIEANAKHLKAINGAGLILPPALYRAAIKAGINPKNLFEMKPIPKPVDGIQLPLVWKTKSVYVC